MKPWSEEEVFFKHKYDVVSFGKHHHSFCKYLTEKQYSCVLDIGCGNGNVLGCVSNGIRYIGTDINPHCIETAKKKYGSRAEFHLFDVEVDDLEKINLPDKKDLCVYIDSVFTMLDDPNKFIEKLFSISSSIYMNRTFYGGTKTVKTLYKWGGMTEKSPLWKFSSHYFHDILPDDWNLHIEGKIVIMEKS